MYVNVRVSIPFVCYKNTIFVHICMKPVWLSGRYWRIWLCRPFFDPQISQWHLFQSKTPFALKIYPLKPLEGQWKLESPQRYAYMHIYASTYIYIHIQTDTYITYMYIYIHYNESYMQIQTDTCTYIHIHAHTGVYKCQHRYTHIRLVFFIFP